MKENRAIEHGNVKGAEKLDQQRRAEQAEVNADKKDIRKDERDLNRDHADRNADVQQRNRDAKRPLDAISHRVLPRPGHAPAIFLLDRKRDSSSGASISNLRNPSRFAHYVE